MDPKYVVIDSNSYGPIMFIFAPMITHGKFCRMVIQKNEKVLSAGFIHRLFEGEGKIYCYGESVSLRVKCKPGIDNILLNRLLDKRIV